jgi:hypothetical protein
MSGQYVAVSTVTMGPERGGPCRHGCGGTEVSFDVFALDVTGVLRIGEVSLHPPCADLWWCAFCPMVFAVDGRSAHGHMAKRHAA